MTDAMSVQQGTALECPTCHKMHSNILLKETAKYDLYALLHASGTIEATSDYEFCSIKCANKWANANKAKMVIEMARL